ncbi:M28 family peptidase [Lentzea kentuckyensis]|uniref:M28 family peptidase n=1 Tax=Lentzea kentuckyensis TaxID=360086 RepID=UPI000A3754E9|nr:M28 family peptidase [Lentzea kentuckyensis]
MIAAACALVVLLGSTAVHADPESSSYDGVHRHLTALHDIAVANGGTRTSGGAGYDASAEYVAGQLRAAGYEVVVQDYPFPVYTSKPELRIGTTNYTAGRDFSTMLHSPGGTVTAPVTGVDLVLPPGPAPDTSSSGCEPADFTGFPAGHIALLQRGTCNYRTKALNAQAAGAVAAVVFNEGQPGRVSQLFGNLSSPGVTIPVLSASFETGARLARPGTTAQLATGPVTTAGLTRNLTAQTSAVTTGEIVVVGAYLDSAPSSPGANSNASGAAAVLDLAVRMSRQQPQHAVRFAWFGSHEVHASGATHYAFTLPPDEAASIAAYVDVDAIGSRNHIVGVHGHARADAWWNRGPVATVFDRYFDRRHQPHERLGGTAESDARPFADIGVPTATLTAGTTGTKTWRQQALYGGRAGKPYDPCRAIACDGPGNVDRGVLRLHARALEQAVAELAHRPPARR